MNFESERLLFTSISPTLARKIVVGQRQPDWHPEYPLEDELDPLKSLAATLEPDPFFTMYVIRRKSDALAIGGFGFFGPPDEAGRVEFGYGLVPAARNQGLATETVLRFVKLAAEHGATSAAADTTPQNHSSQRVLQKAGFHETLRDDGAIYFNRPCP